MAGTTVRDLVDAILDNKPGEVRETLDEVLTAKATEAIDFKKVAIARGLVGVPIVKE